MCVKLFGEFLDQSLPQLPRSTTRVALIYNVKAEAPSKESLTSGNDKNTPTEAPSRTISDNSPERVTAIRPVSMSNRVNDLYAEWDTMDTINAVKAAIAERYDVIMIEANEEAYQKILENRPFFAFNMAEGLNGVSRESQIPAILEMLGVPYLGSDPLTLALCLDKSRAKEILAHHGIPTAGFTVIRNEDQLGAVVSAASMRDGVSGFGFSLGRRQSALLFPVIVKPLHEGSSKGIYDSSVVRSTEEFERAVLTVIGTYGEPALVEEFLPGREFTVGILGNGSRARTLPIVEIKFDALPPDVNRIYSYEAKWIWDRAENPLQIFECPAKLESALGEKINRTCLDAYRVLNCRDWARVDIRLDARDEPHVIELNPLPGILPRPEDNSCLPKAARAAGLSYAELINTVLDIAMRRCGIPVASSQPQMAEMVQ